jgi:hypothetical protein
MIVNYCDSVNIPLDLITQPIICRWKRLRANKITFFMPKQKLSVGEQENALLRPERKAI